MKVIVSIISALWACVGLADSLVLHEIPMETQGSRTYYVQSTIQGVGESMLLVDTGSGHSVINEDTLNSLKSSGDAHFLRNLQGVLADGSIRIVPLYRISAITLGDGCVINDVEAAVLPNNSRQILGISTLQKAAPFGLSFNPPTLSLSNCESPTVQTAREDTTAPIIAPSPIPVEGDQKLPAQKVQAVATAG